MTTKTTIDSIRNTIWRCCDALRGLVDASQYKDYILTLLFVKYLSDLNRELRDDYAAEYDGDQSRIDRAMSRERFVLPKGADFDSLYQARSDDDVGDKINKALEAIEEANKAKLENVFRNIDFGSEPNLGPTKERNATLKHLLEEFNSEGMDLSPKHVSTDVLGDVYEYLVGQFASDAGKKGGEFYTPTEVSQLLGRILKAKPGDRVYDPCCGSGSLLIQACSGIKADKSGSRNIAPYGQEMNGATWALCKMNMFLHGLDRAQIERGDTLRSPELVSDHNSLMTFNVVTANPPFSLDKWGHEDLSGDQDKYRRFHRGTPPKSRADWAFISHMIESMDTVDGRVGVVVPHGVLFRGGGERTIRKAVIEENLLDGVIGLPANLFYGVGIPAALMFFRRDRKPGDDIFFIDASSEFEKGKQQNKLLPEHLDKIVTTWEARQEVEKYAHVADLAEIEANDFNLNIPLYVDTFEEEEPVDMDEVKRTIACLDDELARTRAELDKAMAELGL